MPREYHCFVMTDTVNPINWGVGKTLEEVRELVQLFRNGRYVGSSWRLFVLKAENDSVCKWRENKARVSKVYAKKRRMHAGN